MKDPEKISARRKKIGVIIVVAAAIFFGNFFFSWLKLLEDQMPVEVYFPSEIHGLEKGADVIFGGEKIGNVAGVSLVRVRNEKGEEEVFARVSAFLDFESFEKKISGTIKIQDFKKEIKNQIGRGLRAKTLKTSMAAYGLVLELYFAPKSEANFARKSPRKTLEIPTGKNEKKSFIAEFNARFSGFDAAAFPKKISNFQQNLEDTLTFLNALNSAQINEKAIAGTAKISEILDSEKFNSEFRDLNEKLEKLSEKIERGNDDVAEILGEIFEKLRALSGALNEVSAEIKNLSNPLKMSDPAAFDALENCREKIENFSRELRKFIP